MWMFLDLRQDAITKLLSFPMTAQMVLLGHLYSSAELITEGCSALVSRSTSLTDEEAKELGYETAFQLCIVREKRYQGTAHSPQQIQVELTRTFEKQLAVIAKEEAQYGARKPRQRPPQPIQPLKKRKH